LKEAGLGGAHLQGADLFDADLEGARLGGAHLEGADLFGARLEGAHLFHAHLEGPPVGTVHLEGARANERTVWPEKFDWRAAGVIVGGEDTAINE